MDKNTNLNILKWKLESGYKIKNGWRINEIYDETQGILDDGIIMHNTNNIAEGTKYNIDFWDMPIINITQNFNDNIDDKTS